MYVLAHIGGIPVEEWLPFLIPVLALYFAGRRRNRRREAAVNRLPDPSEGLDEDATTRVLARWTQAKHAVPREYIPILYPPGPDGKTASELAERIHADPATIGQQLEALEDLGYLELHNRDGDTPRVWLTIKGYDLLEETEQALLSAPTRGASESPAPT